MTELFASGAIDAAVGDIKINSPEIKPLIHNAREAGLAYFRKPRLSDQSHRGD